MRRFAILLCGCGRLGFDTGDQEVLGDAADLRACAERLPGMTGRWGFEGNFDAADGTSSTALGGPTFGPGHTSQAVILDGADDLIQLPASLAVDDYSFSFWVRTTDVGTGKPGELWYEGKSLIDAELCGTPATGDFGTALIDGGHITASGTSEHSAAIVNDDAWHHIVFTRARTAGRTALYLDGTLANDGGEPTPALHAEIPWIGIGNNPCRVNSNFLAGQFDEVAFYDRAIAPAEVASLFACVDP